MEEIFKKIVDELNTSVIILLAIMMASYWFVYIIARLSARFYHHEKKLGKVDELTEKLVEMRTKVDLIYQNTNPRRLVESFSPIAINDLGREIVRKINADVIFEKYAARLQKGVEEMTPTNANAYDIQAASMRVAKEKMMAMLDANEINTVKQEAFQSGLLAEDILSVFGVYLRDRILGQRGIAVAEVDKHAPPIA